MFYKFNAETKEYVKAKSGETWLEDSNWELVYADYKGWVPWIPGPNAKSPVKNETGTGYAKIKLRDGSIMDSVSVWDDTVSYSRQVIAYRPFTRETQIPPVGTVCEYQNNSICDWRKIEITAIGKKRFLYWDVKDDSEFSILIAAAGNFRALADTRRIESLSKAILDSVNRDGVDFCHHESVMAERIIDSIRNGHVEGIELAGDGE